MWQLLIPAVTGLLDKLIPDPAQAAEAKMKMLEMAQKGELAVLDAEMKLALGQMEINKAEASTDIFRGGWRPFCGWVCGFGLAYTFLIAPILPYIINAAGGNVPPMPQIDTDTLMVLLTGMLGLGGLRSFEKLKGKG